MGSQRKIVQLVLMLGIILYPAFYILDLATYPGQRIPILIVRGSVTIGLLIIYVLTKRVSEKQIFVLMLIGFGIAAVGVSLICVVSGEGFASSYYTGVLEIVLLSMALYSMAPKRYALIVGTIVVQHFAINWFVPWEYKDLLTNIFTLGVISTAVLVLHNIIFRINKENEQLRGLLPICSHCKKIRDPKGLWHQIDEYIHEHSGVEFSHGICPECARYHYGDFITRI